MAHSAASRSRRGGRKGGQGPGRERNSKVGQVSPESRGVGAPQSQKCATDLKGPLVLDEMALMKSFVGRSGRRIGGASRMHGHGSVQTMSTLPTH